MNKTELKKFAVNARRELLKQVSLRANLFGITKKTGLTIEEQFGQLMINGNSYPTYMKLAFLSMQKQLEQKGYEQVLEEVAYTWFNRIIAIRYMEIHDYLPERVNVLSSSTGRIDPDILTDYETMELSVDKTKIKELLANGETEGAYRLLFIAQCNALNITMPFMFEKIQDYTELLLPDYLLDKESIINVLVKNDELTKSFDEIEVIGGLYQYYIAEEKDRVFKQKSKYKKEEIPFATQLFTPNWIVKYMVQNTLGRYWTEAHPEDRDLVENWDYFIESKFEENNFNEKIAPYINKELKVEDIKCFDPAMGSGHILVYMFEVLYEIYTKCGYPEREIPRLILENNLYGLDIDDRAYQLASFSVVMKAVQYNKRFLRSIQRHGITLNLASIQETNTVSNEIITYIAGDEQDGNYNRIKSFFDQYHNAKTYGSLINVNERDILLLEKRLEALTTGSNQDLFQIENHDIAIEILPDLIKQTKIMSNVYDIVVMNPPYMGSGNMSKELTDFLKKNYPDSKADLFAAFMEINHYLKKNGYYAAINQHSWLFLSAFKKLRLKLLNTKEFFNFLHLGSRTFEEISGEVVQSVAFVFKNKIPNSNTVGNYIQATNIKNPSNKRTFVLEVIKEKNEFYYSYQQQKFKNMPDYLIAYWISDEIYNIFIKNPSLQNYINFKQASTLGDNEKFLRFWYEVSQAKINQKWYYCLKGGRFRKWYGNHEYIVNWENNGEEIIKNGKATIRSKEFLFRPGLSWSRISSTTPSFRVMPSNFFFESASGVGFMEPNLQFTMLGLLNSTFTKDLLSFINPTLTFQSGNLAVLPFEESLLADEKIPVKVEQCINLCKEDWDSNETSWEFKTNPFLLQGSSLLSENYLSYEAKKNNAISTLKTLEEEINIIILQHYKLENTFSKNVSENQLTLTKLNKNVEVIKFLSYFIGCVVGRYSLNMEGLAFAGGKWDDAKYLSFDPSKHGIIQFTDAEYFKHDIIARLREFLSVVFNVDTVDDNIQWLAEALELKKGEDAEARLRRYFMDEFFADHCRMYQKRQIYWLVDSGKHKGLRTLIYMHRYQSDTMATIRFEHLQEIQGKYNHEIHAINMRLLNSNLSVAEKRNLEKQIVFFKKRLEELLEFDKKLAGYANSQIEIDLDDGVVANYAKFDGVLRKIK